MANDGEALQAIFNNLPCADVVDDQVTFAICRFEFCYQPNVGNSFSQVLTHHIARKIICGFVADWLLSACPFKIDHEVGNSAVVDVLVGLFKSPDFWI